MEVNSIAGDELQTTQPATGKKHSRKRSVIIFTVVSIINLSLLVLLWTLLLTPRSTTSQSNDSSLVGDMSSPLLGRAAPNFTLPSMSNNGAQVSLTSFKGKPVVINFWEASCQPCNAEAPFLQQSWKQMQPKGVALIGIDGPESVSAARAFVQKYDVTYTNVRDTIDGATSINYGTTGNPETFFIDAHGIVQARWIGALTSAGLKANLAKIHVA